MGMLSIVSRASLKSTLFAPATASPRGMPRASVRRLRLVPRLARSVGFGPVFFPSERCFRHRAVHRQPVPVDPDDLVVPPKCANPRLLEHARLGPFHETPMRRGARADARAVQRVPLASGAGYEKDRIHRVAIRYARVVTPEWMCRRFGQQRFDLHPKLVGNPPAVVSCYKSHGPRQCPQARPMEKFASETCR